MKNVKHMTWWGWGEEGVFFNYQNKPAFAPFVRANLGVELRPRQVDTIPFDASTVQTIVKAIQAAGLAHVTAKLHLCEAVVYFPLLFYAMHAFGLPGAAMAWTARVGLDLALLAWLSQRMVFSHDVFPRMRHNFPSTEPQRTDTP